MSSSPDKGILIAGAESTGLENLLETLLSESDIAVRSVEPQVKALRPTEAAQLFANVQERVLRQGAFTTRLVSRV
jgi:hypothetical protein